MEITLNDRDVETLASLLRDYLPQLKMETARTDDREYRRNLLRREGVCERLLEQLALAKAAGP